MKVNLKYLDILLSLLMSISGLTLIIIGLGSIATFLIEGLTPLFEDFLSSLIFTLICYVFLGFLIIKVSWKEWFKNSFNLPEERNSYKRLFFAFLFKSVGASVIIFISISFAATGAEIISSEFYDGDSGYFIFVSILFILLIGVSLGSYVFGKHLESRK